MFRLLTLVVLGIASLAAAVKVGDQAPNFTLSDSQGAMHSLADFSGKVVILEWINHGCPFVRKHYDTHNMQSLQLESTEQGAVWLSICSSAPGKQGHYAGAELAAVLAKNDAKATAYLIDESGEVGKNYGAVTTPHCFVINEDGVIIYAGAIDDKSGTSKSEVQGALNYVRQALGEHLAGSAVSVPETRPYGCSVKYPN